MRKITAIEPQKKNPNRVNIALEGQFAFGLSRLVAAWLAVGQTLSDEKIAALLADDAREAALQKALLFLGYRARSSQEVRQNLAKHEIPEIVIAETLARLERSGLLNDGEFAHAWVENRSTFRLRGRRALKLELRQKGLSEESIQSALEQAASEDSLALEAARKYVRKLRGLDWLTFRNKLGGFLARRGFGYDVIAPVVRQVWNDYSNNLNDEDVG